MRGRADYMKLGVHNALCDRCQRKYKSDELQEEWTGWMVCKRCYEPRHPQDFLKGHADNPQVEWTRPDSNVNTNVTTVDGKNLVSDNLRDLNGDKDVTLTFGTNNSVQEWGTTFTQNRVATISTANAIKGDRFDINKNDGSSFVLSVGNFEALETINNITSYNSFSDAPPWTAGSAPLFTVNSDLAPNGLLEATTITDANSSGASRIRQDFVMSGDAITFVVFIKKDLDETRYPAIGLVLPGSASTNTRINTKTGETSTSTGGTTIGSVTVVTTTVAEYWMVSITVFNSSGGSGSGSVTMWCAYNSSFLLPVDNSVTGSAVFWGAGFFNEGINPIAFINININSRLVTEYNGEKWIQESFTPYGL